MSDSPRPILLLSDPRFSAHKPVGHHPERPERRQAAEDGARQAQDLHGNPLEYLTIPPRAATDDELLRVHTPALLANLQGWVGRTGNIDPDTYVGAESVAVARDAVGGTIDLVSRILDGEAKQGLALVRPPGHHAERNRSMGFCLVNNVAAAAAAARARGLARVAIVDFDVHHGNGTQDIFWEDPTVLYVSTHQWPFYPSTGKRGERGEGAGEGFTVNVPLDEGSDDAVYRGAFERVVVPVLDAFAPNLVLVSAGYDASMRDPLGQMRLSAEAFGWMTEQLKAVADRHSDGRIALALEGGYDLPSLTSGVRASAEALAGKHFEIAQDLDAATIGAAVGAAKRYWPVVGG
jgi:acetoin utilization deacetylase AcuC-like enzyme